MAAAVSGLSPVIITVLMPIRRSSAKRSLMPPLTMSLSWITPRPARRRGHHQRRAALPGDPLAPSPLTLVRNARRPAPGRRPRWRRRRPCGSAAAVQVHAAHARLGGEGDERAPCGFVRCPRRRAGRTSPWPARRCCGPRASRRPARRAGRRRPVPRRVTPSAGMNAAAWRLPSVIVPVLSSSSTSTSPAASTARPDMAITLAGSGGPCRRCRWPTAARRWSWGSGRPAGPPAR